MGSGERFEFGDFVVDPSQNRLTRGDQCSQVPPRVMDVLLYLLVNRERVVPTAELLDEFWAGRVVDESALHRVVNQIRRHLGDSARDPRYIRTISKRGYQAIGPVRRMTQPGQPTPDRAAGHASGPAFGSNVRVAIAALLVTVVAVAGLGFLWSTRDSNDPPELPPLPNQHSVAVLPFVNLSDDPGLGFFADGLVDGVLDRLARYDLKVASRTDTFEYAGQPNLRSIARKLNVAYVVEGSVQKSGGDLRLTGQLIRAHDGFHVWSKIYDRPLDAGFDTQTELAQNLAHLVRSMLWSDVRRQYPDGFPEFQGVDRRAVELFLDAEEQYALLQMGEGGDWDYHVELIESAVAIDPQFANGHEELAWAYLKRLGGHLDIAESRRRARAALEKAVELGAAPSIALLRRVQIWVELDLDYARAEAATRTGLDEYPRKLWWHYYLAMIAMREGREADARRLMETANVLDYGYEQSGFDLGDGYVALALGDYDRALDAAARALSLTDGGTQRALLLRLKAEALIGMGDADAAIAAIDDAWRISGASNAAPFIHLFAAIGARDRAEKLLATVEKNHDQSYDLARGHLTLGDAEAALKWLGIGIDQHNDMVLSTLRLGRQWDPLRTDERFQTLIERLESKENPTHLVDGRDA